MLLLYGLANAFAAWSFPTYRNASGVEDLGHLLVPPLLPILGREKAQYVSWMGTLPLELFFVVIALVVLFTGKGIRLGIRRGRRRRREETEPRESYPPTTFRTS